MIVRLFFGAMLPMALVLSPVARGDETVDIGSRRELFVDRFLVDKFEGSAELHMHRPTPQEVMLVTDQPWEGNTCAYYTLFQDGDIYRMYYRGSQHPKPVAGMKAKSEFAHQFACYAESKDGRHWTKPALGLHEFAGSKQNNIILVHPQAVHNFTPFKDANPKCAADARYKALGGSKRSGGLLAFKSSDGIHWSPMTEKPVITKGAFDSQNLAFWDPVRKCYADYHRDFRNRVRDIMTCTSTDFLHWSEPVFLEYPGSPAEHLYTNAVSPCPRAQQILIGFPARYYPSDNHVEPVLMTSRDGHTFHRWADPVIPVTAPQDRAGNRSNYMAWGILSLPGAEKELSVYGTEAYYGDSSSRLRRFTYRVDGFASVRATAAGGEVFTRPLRFQGDRLVLNYATSPQGSLSVEIQDPAGKPLKGFELADCTKMQDDSIKQAVSWSGGGNVRRLAGRPIRLRFVLRDGDLYSLRFAPGSQPIP